MEHTIVLEKDEIQTANQSQVKGKSQVDIRDQSDDMKIKLLKINEWTTVPCIRRNSGESLEEVIKHIYHEWKISNPPKYILSVTGGAQDFELKKDVQEAFKVGIIKAAKSTGAWIITGGTNYGVMKMVGDAVEESIQSQDLMVLGIATESVVTDGVFDELGCLKNNRSTELNPNHTHFILVYKYIEEKEANDNKKKEKNEKCGNRNNNEDNIINQDIKEIENKLKNIENQTMEKKRKQKDFGQEIEFRSKLESEFLKSSGRMVLIVVAGGPGTYKTVAETLEKSIPILLLENSGGCADIVIEFYNNYKNKNEKTKLSNDDIIKKVIDEYQIKKTLKSNLEKILEQVSESKNEHLINIFKINNDNDMEQAILKALIKITFIKNEEKNNSKTIDEYYENFNKDHQKNMEKIKAFKENMNLAIKWNAIYIAKTDCLPYIKTIRKGIIEETELYEEFKEKALGENELKRFEEIKKCIDQERSELKEIVSSSFDQAILEDRPNFVELIMDNDLIKSDDINIENIYNKMLVADINKKLPFVVMLEKTPVDNEKNYKPEQINETLRKLTWRDLDITDQLFQEKHIKQSLFILALLFNRYKIAFYFWRKGNHPIANALFASRFLEKLSNQYKSSSSDELMINSKKFSQAAIKTLKVVDLQTHYFINYVTLFRNCSYFKTNALEIAIACKNEEFVSHPTIQIVFDDIWFGFGIIEKFNLFDVGFYKFMASLATIGLLAPIFYGKSAYNRIEGELEGIQKKYSDEQTYTSYFKKIIDKAGIYYKKDSTEETTGNKVNYTKNSSDLKENGNDTVEMALNRQQSKINRMTFRKTYVAFMSTPIVHFNYALMFYIQFLCVFSYTLMKELEESIEKMSKIWFTILNVMFFSLFVEEIHQMIHPIFRIERPSDSSLNRKCGYRILNSIKYYFKDKWNLPDTLGLILFLVADTLLLISIFSVESTKMNLFSIAKALFCVDLIIWFLRALHFCALSRFLGPKLKILERIIKDDLRFFITAIGIISIGFGIVSYVALNAGEKSRSDENNNQSSSYENFNKTYSIGIIRRIVDSAYWPIFGDLKIYDQVQCTSTECPNTWWHSFVFSLLMLYTLAILVLVNLLIAMFNSTFENIHNKTDIIWKYQRYYLIFGYFNYSIVPPPFNLFYRIAQFFKYCLSGSTNVNNENNEERNPPKSDNSFVPEKYVQIERQCAIEQWRDFELRKKIGKNNDI